MALDRAQTEDALQAENAALRERIASLEAELRSRALDRGVLHEVSNLVTLLSLALPDLTGSLDGGASRDVADQLRLLDDVSRALRDILWVRQEVSRERPTAGGVSDLPRIVPAVTRLLRSQARGVAVLAEEIDDVLPVAAPTGVVMQVLLNLLHNAVAAVRASERGDGVITVRVTGTDSAVRLDVSDNGVGIPEDALATVFDRGFTTRRAEGGSGLGLSICRDLVEGSGGFIRARQQRGGGTTMTVMWPPAR